MITKFNDLPLEQRAQVEEMAADMLQSIVSGVELKYDCKQLPLVMVASSFMEDSGFIEVTGGTPKSVMAGFSYCKVTEKGFEYLKNTNQG